MTGDTFEKIKKGVKDTAEKIEFLCLAEGGGSDSL